MMRWETLPARTSIRRFNKNTRLIMSEDVVAVLQHPATARHLTADLSIQVFRGACALRPTLELAFVGPRGVLGYRWKADERAFRHGCCASARQSMCRSIRADGLPWTRMATTVERKMRSKWPTDLSYVNVNVTKPVTPYDAFPTSVSSGLRLRRASVLPDCSNAQDRAVKRTLAVQTTGVASRADPLAESR
jgi:hypothetical protein